MKFIITTQVTENYYNETKPLINSINKYWKGRFVIGFIDFIPKDYIGEYYLMSRKNIYTYRTDYPINRRDFVCPQGGEFIDYLICDDDDVIIQIDADTIMQREMSDDELFNMIPNEDEILSVYCANPSLTLYDVTKNLNFKNQDNFKYLNNYSEFTGSILIANKKTFIKLKNYIVAEWDDMVKVNSHHAGIQWLISKVSHEHLKVRILNNVYQCGIWYFTFNTTIRDYKLYINDDIVIFNHTKFMNWMFIKPNQ